MEGEKAGREELARGEAKQCVRGQWPLNFHSLKLTRHAVWRVANEDES